VSANPTPASFLKSLSDINAEITIAITVAGQIIPVVKGAYQAIRNLFAGTATEVDYAALQISTQAEILAAIQAAGMDLDVANAELVKLGLPPVTLDPPVPRDAPPAQP
jgi:hypothetical protein